MSFRLLKSAAEQLLIIGVLCFTAYSFMLSGSFSVMDDQVSIVENPLIKSFSHIKEIFTTSFFQGNSYYRPLVSLSYMIEHHFFQLNPFFYKLDNLFLHLLSAFLVYGIIQSIFSQRSISFFVSLLFAIHPIHWEQVSHVAGRAILLCAFFYLLAFWLYCRSRESQSSNFYVLSLLAYSFSFLSKESAVTLPVILFCYENFVRRPAGKQDAWIYIPSVQLRRILPFFGIALAFVLLRRFLGITNIPLWTSWHDLVLGHLTFARGFLTYLRLFLFPLDLHFDRSIIYFQSFQNLQVWLMIVLYVGLSATLFVVRKKISGPTKFFLSWALITILPVAQLIPLPSRNGYASVAEHFLYLPSLGIFVLLVLFFQVVFTKLIRLKWASSRIVAFAVVGFFSYLILFTIQQNIYSSKEIAVLRQSLKHNPQNLRIRNSYALALALKGLFAEAEQQYRIALSINPGNVNSRISLGKALCDQGKLWEGITEYEKIYGLEIGRYKDLLENNRRLAYTALMKIYHQKIAKDPSNPLLHFQLGVLYSKLQHVQEGVDSYKKALELKPLYKDALFNLVWSYEVLGDYQQAAHYCEEMLKLDYDDPKEKEAIYGRLIGLQKMIINQQNELNP